MKSSMSPETPPSTVSVDPSTSTCSESSQNVIFLPSISLRRLPASTSFAGFPSSPNIVTRPSDFSYEARGQPPLRVPFVTVTEPSATMRFSELVPSRKANILSAPSEYSASETLTAPSNSTTPSLRS